MSRIRRLAIVNRGEAAIRALTAVAELNAEARTPSITTLVFYTEPDAGAWFVRAADEAVCLGSASRYLDEPHVIEQLVRAQADAVWVGWGFLAEQASFAQRCEEAGIVFIGPNSETIRLLGDKIAAKRLAEQVGVPVIPWSGGPVESVAAARHQARSLGYPLIVKAAAGGGGRGIRVVATPDQLAGAFTSARDEARLAFGDATVFLERQLPRSRHIEVQVIADGHGTVWAVGTRDCSIQRRHQKVIEESGLDSAPIKDAAVRLMRAAGYRNAGTVEFLVDPESGDHLFLEVNTRLQVEHPVTEATTGLDLVKLQLHVAEDGKLPRRVPREKGHAVEARLYAEDPEHGFVPSPGRLAVLRLPSGAGIRVDTGVGEGDTIPVEFDAMMAKIVACGQTRAEALSRLRRALAQTEVVIEGGTTNRSLLLSLLDRPEVRAGAVDNQWLDRIVESGGHLSAADPVALLAAAVEAYQADATAARAAFHAQAARGRPELPDDVGHTCALRYRGMRYAVKVFRTGPHTYRVHAADAAVDVDVAKVDSYQRMLTVGARRHQITVVARGPGFRVDVDGAAHTIDRDDGGVVRCGWPAIVVAIRVAPGDVVAQGDPLVVLESMKMESTVGAPYAGVVSEVDIAPNVQVEVGAPLLRIRATTEDSAETSGARVDLSALTASESAAPCQRVYAALSSYLLGYDLDPSTVHDLLARQARLTEISPPDDAELVRCEDNLLDLFADVGSLYRPSTDNTPADTQEYLLSYLQWLDADRAGLPDGYRERLRQALSRYGITGLERTPEVEESVVWMFRSFSRVQELAPVVARILRRRLRLCASLTSVTPPAELRARLDRLAAATQGRQQTIADLARDVRFHFLDEPMLAGLIEAEYAEVDARLAMLRDDPDRADHDELVARLVQSPQPLRGTLLRHWLGHAEGRFRQVLLEVYTRRYYRTRALGHLDFPVHSGQIVAVTDYDVQGKPIHLVTSCAGLAELPELARAVAAHRQGIRRNVVVDLLMWRPGSRPDIDALAAEVEKLLGQCDFGGPLWRLDISVTSAEGTIAEHLRTQHLTYRQPDGERFEEDRLYRNLHPMLAKRLDVWRLSNFALRRLDSAEDVYLFHGIAHDNPSDHRLFALAEVRDLTPVVHESGATSYPRLEWMGLRALAAMREALGQFAEPDRPTANRIVLYVRPLWTLPRGQWHTLARSLAPLAAGAGLEKAVLRVRMPEDRVLHVSGFGRHGITVCERPPGTEPVRPLTAYRQKVLRAQRLGAPYPFEIIRMLAPLDGVVGRFPHGHFTEYDLDETGSLTPAVRPPGENTANIVLGLLTNQTVKVPEGMTRVALLGDPTRGLGNLAEPECRRIIAGLDLAERLGIPVEWFALSSGARIAMDSGTENMDWISAVLRRLIEFTQRGGEVNVVVTGVNVGAQPYWNAEATMLMHTKGILVMTPNSAMVLTGKQALDFSGGVSAEDNFGIGGFDRVMGPNGQGQYWAPTLEDACDILLRHYEHTYVVPGEAYPRRATTTDPADRDVRQSPHPDAQLCRVGDVFSAEHNAERKRPFDIRAVLRSVTDTDSTPLERWNRWRGAETAVVWDAHIGGIPVCLLGLESRTVARRGFVPGDGPPAWTSGTLFPQSSRKLARAINAASGSRPVVVLANLSGFDGSPESMRHWQLEYGAEIGRAVTNFHGPIVFVVVSRYHGGAFVVFSKRLNERLEIAAIDGSYASVIGGAPAAATVFAREVVSRTDRDPRVSELAALVRSSPDDPDLAARLAATRAQVRAEKLGDVADEFDAVHSIQRALAVGSVDRIIPPQALRPYLIHALERGMALPSMSESAPPRQAQVDPPTRRGRRAPRTHPAGHRRQP